MRTSSGRDARPCTDPVKCRSCGADILWAITGSGKRMPMDSEPDMRPPPKGGNMVLTVKGGPFGELHVEAYYRQTHGEKRNRYTSHFGTCPNADEHRRQR